MYIEHEIDLEKQILWRFQDVRLCYEAQQHVPRLSEYLGSLKEDIMRLKKCVGREFNL